MTVVFVCSVTDKIGNQYLGNIEVECSSFPLSPKEFHNVVNGIIQKIEAREIVVLNIIPLNGENND